MRRTRGGSERREASGARDEETTLGRKEATWSTV